MSAPRPLEAGALADDPFDARVAPEPPWGALPARWMGWRLRALVVLALLGGLTLFALLRTLAAVPTVPATWVADPAGKLVLVDSRHGPLAALAGSSLESIAGADGRAVRLDEGALPRSTRWLLSDAQRTRQQAMQEEVARALAGPVVTLRFERGVEVAVSPRPRGWQGLGLLVWPVAAFSLFLYLVGMAVLLARPEPRNVLYALMTTAQSFNLLCIAVESLPGLGSPPGWATTDPLLRMTLDGMTAAAAAHAAALHPQRLAAAPAVAAVAWGAWAVVQGLAWSGLVGGQWIWTQALMLALGGLALAVLTLSNRRHPHPYALVLRRFGVAALGTLALATLGAVLATEQAGLSRSVALLGSVTWSVFFTSLLLLFPFLARSRQVWREFALLAGISTLATSLDLLFVTVFGFGELASLALAVFLAIGAYAAGRQWVVNRLLGRNMLTTERVFEQLYRVARELQQQPRRHAALLTELLRDLFDPLHSEALPRSVPRARVAADGSALLVPLPDADGQPRALLLRYAGRGRRIFTREDARLASRVVEQLRRAVAYDAAVERGRSEERARIAQDLHDDIGARLLTMMYQSPSPEMEDYIRHTLQDLKTLTRGLAAAEHRLTHAAGEWKADIGQRLSAASIELVWSFAADEDLELGVVQWSALTRVLRELVNNIISHARATRVEISATVEGRALVLLVADDGVGRAPQAWSHGLGLGGVRKRVKLLGGSVAWREREGGGIACEVRVPELGTR